MVYYIFILLEATFLLRSGFTCKGEFSCGSNAFSHRDQAWFQQTSVWMGPRIKTFIL